MKSNRKQLNRIYVNVEVHKFVSHHFRTIKHQNYINSTNKIFAINMPRYSRHHAPLLETCNAIQDIQNQAEY